MSPYHPGCGSFELYLVTFSLILTLSDSVTINQKTSLHRASRENSNANPYDDDGKVKINCNTKSTHNGGELSKKTTITATWS